jgi:CheY-like chemotaxis protein
MFKQNTAHRPDSPTLLIVEDDEAIRFGLGMVMSKAGFEVSTAINGRDGLNVIVEKRPDLVITDIRMPEMDGLQMLDAIKSRVDTRQTKVMVLSASPGDQRTALDNGACRFERKPFATKSIIEAAFRILETSKLKPNHESFHFVHPPHSFSPRESLT